MDRRSAVGAILAGTLAATTTSFAQPATRIYTVAVLFNSVPGDQVASGKFTRPAPNLIVNGMRDRGWVEGKNVRYLWRSVEGNYERFPQALDELINLKPDAVVVFSDSAARIALQKTNAIPVVVAGAVELLESGIIESLQRPGVNLTGMSMDGLNLGAKRLELLKAAVPSVSRVAMLWHRAQPVSGQFLSDQAEAVAKRLGMEVFQVVFRGLDAMPEAFSQVLSKRANGLLVANTAYLYQREYQLPIHEFAVKHRIPAMHAVLNAVESGGLMTYAPDILEFYRAAPRYIDKILRGAKAAEIPIETPSKFEFVINMKTARAMGLRIPSAALSLADRVIK